MLAGGKNPVFIPKADKYRLFLEIEQSVRDGNNINSILAALNISRAAYFGHVWFPPEKAKLFAEELERQAAEAAAPKITQAPKKKKLPPNAQRKLDLITEVSRLRYVVGMNFDEACRKAGIRTDRFYAWSSQRDRLIRIAKGREPEATKERNGSLNGHAKRGRKPKEEVDQETLELRRQMVEVIHEKVREGAPLLRVLAEKRVRAADYHKWAQQTQIEILPREKPIDLWHAYKNAEGRAKEDARDRFLKHFQYTVERIAHHYAETSRLGGSFVDEEMLISVGLYEGVAQHMDTFDESRGVQITAYFSGYISKRILDEMRVQDWVPRLERTRERSIRNIGAEFYRVMHRHVRNDDELADYANAMGIQLPELHKAPHHRSLDEVISPREGGNGDHKERTRAEFVESDELSQDREFQRNATLVEDVLRKCHGDDRVIFIQYYMEGRTMKEVGEGLNLSESRISQMHGQAMERLHGILAKDPSMPAVRTA